MKDKTLALAAVLFLLAFAVRLVDIDTPHAGWDEVSRYQAGLAYWYNIAKLKFDEESWNVNPAHPPFAKYVYGVAYGAYIFSKAGFQLFSLDFKSALKLSYDLMNFVPGRLVSAVFGSATAAILAFFIARRSSLSVGLLAGGLLALFPLFIAHTKLANLDSIAGFFIVAALLVLAEALEKDDRRLFALFALLTGLAIASKFSGAVVFVVAPFIFFAVKGRKHAAEIIKAPRKYASKYVLLLATPVIALAILLVMWPWLWNDTLNNFAFSAFSFQLETSYTHLPLSEYFFGQVMQPTIFYYLAHLLFTVPEIILFVALFSLVTPRDKLVRVFWAWLLAGLIMFSIIRFKQNGIQYAISLYAPVAALAAIGTVNLAGMLGKAFKRRDFFKPLAGVLLLYALFVAASSHPYYVDYYNAFAGGPSGVYASKMLTLNTQGEGTDAAVEWVNGNAAPGSTVQLFIMPRHVVPPLKQDLMELDKYVPEYLVDNGIVPPDTRVIWYMNETVPRADYIVTNLFYRWYVNDPRLKTELESNYVLAHEVNFQGVPLARVYERQRLTLN
jgi:hypothetical protein